MLRNMTAIYLMAGENILLLYRRGSRVVPDCYTGTAGGHFEPDELNDPLACVMRELQEETGLTADDITAPALRYVTLRCTGGEIRQNYYFFANLHDTSRIVTSAEGDIIAVKPEDALGLKMPHTAKFMCRHWLDIGRHDNRLYCGAADADGVQFTVLSEESL